MGRILHRGVSQDGVLVGQGRENLSEGILEATTSPVFWSSADDGIEWEEDNLYTPEFFRVVNDKSF